ncbi:hypothetical protein [Actinomadura sp. B10D3]|uniref:hypothetical protein n=1 Tax=Actinomadura sp. B10D3 TaxID=3153557 RepID=UPI00325E7102
MDGALRANAVGLESRRTLAPQAMSTHTVIIRAKWRADQHGRHQQQGQSSEPRQIVLGHGDEPEIDPGDVDSDDRECHLPAEEQGGRRCSDHAEALVEAARCNQVSASWSRPCSFSDFASAYSASGVSFSIESASHVLCANQTMIEPRSVPRMA